MKQVATAFETQKTQTVSPWVLPLQHELGRKDDQPPLWDCYIGFFSFQLAQSKQSIWTIARFPDGGRMAVRMLYCPDGNLEVRHVEKGERAVKAEVHCTMGDFRLSVEFPHQGELLFHAKTSFTPSTSLAMPYWPRDLIILGNENDPLAAEGVIYTSQSQHRSGMMHLALTYPVGGSALYFQNLTSLNEYCEQTGTELTQTVRGQWPELGFSLPTNPEKPLEAGKELTVSDVYMVFDGLTAKDDIIMSRQFLGLLSQIYMALPPVETQYRHWPDIAEKSLADLSNSAKVWSEFDGQRYINAYVGDFETPPESMVQLGVLLPLLEYAKWSGKELPITQDLLAGLPNFFDQQVKVLGRWLISAQNKLDGSEPQKNPRVMDSWYLYHSLINLSRLANRGHEEAKKLFLESLDYAVRVAQHFNYKWPVFYNLDTLQTVQAETKKGEGGEKDVAGLYTHLMMQAWNITKKTEYLDEAQKAAQSLVGLGFNMFYQANEVLFASGAMLRLWKETGDELYRDLSYVCMANIFNNVHLWECRYGYSKNFSSYFALFPLKDAPYTAVYEELEGFAAFHDYLYYMGDDCPPELKILTAEYIRMLLDRAFFYYPANLPADMLAEKSRTGEIDRALWIPLEDLYDGWDKAGTVGQEVYGSGLPFGLITRHYWQTPNEKFMFYVDYPTQDFSAKNPGEATFRILGDARFFCRMRIIPLEQSSLPSFEVQLDDGEISETLYGTQTPEGHLEYSIHGDCKVTVRWARR